MSPARLLAVVVFGLASCVRPSSQPTPAQTKATLFFSVNTQGYVGPCGCSENMRGGIARVGAQLESARAEAPVLFIDVGDGLFGAKALAPESVAQQERKARALAEAWKKMGLTVRLPGPFDDARGEAFRRGLELPELSVGRGRVEALGSSRVVLLAAKTGAEAVAAATMVRNDAAFVVALVEEPYEALLKHTTGEAPPVDLFIPAVIGSADKAEENRVGGSASKVAQPQSKGRSLFRVDLTLAGGGRAKWRTGAPERELFALDQRIEIVRTQVNEPGLGDELKTLRQAKLVELIARREAVASAPLPAQEGASAQYSFVPLETTAPESSAIAAIVERYDREVGALNLAWANEHGRECATPSAAEPRVVGSASCASCHASATAFFQKTKHAEAFKTLEGKGKGFHLDCVGCHVTGWQKPGGVCRIDKTAGRAEVGCEACHGPGSRHVVSPSGQNIVRVAAEETCRGCHDRENSPHFDFERYRREIVGPGHSEKVE